MKILKRFFSLFSDTDEITEEVIVHFEKNPDELDLIINKEYFNAFYRHHFHTWIRHNPIR